MIGYYGEVSVERWCFIHQIQPSKKCSSWSVLALLMALLSLLSFNYYNDHKNNLIY